MLENAKVRAVWVGLGKHMSVAAVDLCMKRLFSEKVSFVDHVSS